MASCRLFRATLLNSIRFTATNHHQYTTIGCHGKYCTLWSQREIFINHFEGRMPKGRYNSSTPSSSSSSDKQVQVEELNILQRFRKILHNFYLGGKVLLGDVKVTWKIRRKLKSNSNNYSVLTRKEQWTMFKTQKNLKKTLPIVILSLLPVIGYLGPIIGFLRPREFLSHHFWTAKQREKYQILDDKERSEYLIHILGDINNRVQQLTGEKKPHDLIHSLINKTKKSTAPRNELLIRLLPTFSSGVFKLENLQNSHLKNMCSFWLFSPWLPTTYLQKRLRREMVEIHKDDAAIIREGIESLDDQEINEACHVRGLNTLNVTSEDMVKWLQNWIDLSKQVSETETSFLAHIAVFKTVNLKSL